MPRTIGELPTGTRITDYISLGVITKTFPLTKVRSALSATAKTSVRQRDLPAHVVVYYVIALALYMQSSYREVLRCLLEGIQWPRTPAADIHVTGKSGISQARTRLGWEPLRQLHDDLVQPIATRETKGAWFRRWRVVSLDGSTLDVADEKANVDAFDRPAASRGHSAYPQIRFVSLVENGMLVFGVERKMATPETERRHSKRFPMVLPVTVKPQDGGEQKCATRDISAGSVFFYCDLRIVQGSPIELVMMLPSEVTGGEKQWVCCHGRVARVVEDSTNKQRGVAVKVERLAFLPEISLGCCP